MQNSQNKKTLQIVLFVLVAVLTLGIGYASITAINLIISGNATASVNDNNFKVYFVNTGDTPSITKSNESIIGSASISNTDNTVAMFDVSGLTKVGDYAIATYTIINNSNDVGAKLSLELTNSNADYFKVTETITDTILQAGDTTTGTIKVEMIKTPIDTEVSTSVTGTLTATPVENASAVGNSSTTKIAVPEPVSFSTDSWATIQSAVQDNKIDAYNLGDTKTIDLGDLGIHTVRIANKSTPSECLTEGFSQSACGFVVEFIDIIENKMMNSAEDTNYGGWEACEVREYLNGELFNKMPEDLKKSITNTGVVFSGGSPNYSENNKLYLLTYKELGNTNRNDYGYNLTRQLDYYRDIGVSFNPTTFSCTWQCGMGDYFYNMEYLIKEYNGEPAIWWLRSIMINDNKGFLTISSSGYPGFTRTSKASYGLSPAFRIG